MAKKKREAQRKEGGSCVIERGRRFPSSSEGSLLPRTLGCPILCVFHPQNKPSPYQNPTFGPTLYNGFGPKTATLQILYMNFTLVWLVLIHQVMYLIH